MKRNIIQWIIMICTLFLCVFKITTHIYDAEIKYQEINTADDKLETQHKQQEEINIFDKLQTKHKQWDVINLKQYCNQINIAHIIVNNQSATEYNVNNDMIGASTGVGVVIVINVYLHINKCYQNYNHYATRKIQFKLLMIDPFVMFQFKKLQSLQLQTKNIEKQKNT
eukprot:325233_1